MRHIVAFDIPPLISCRVKSRKIYIIQQKRDDRKRWEKYWLDLKTVAHVISLKFLWESEWRWWIKRKHQLVFFVLFLFSLVSHEFSIWISADRFNAMLIFPTAATAFLRSDRVDMWRNKDDDKRKMKSTVVEVNILNYSCEFCNNLCKILKTRLKPSHGYYFVRRLTVTLLSNLHYTPQNIKSQLFMLWW